MILQQHLDTVRAKFAHIDQCPFAGKRAFFENAGGALTLKSVVESSSFYAAIPDNQGRTNAASKELVRVIQQAKQDTRIWLNAPDGEVFVGESGTELLFRLIRTACRAIQDIDQVEVLGSSLEHPATVSAAKYWTDTLKLKYVQINHNNDTGCVTAADYAQKITKNTRLATIIHTSPVTGMGVDITAIAAEIRKISPDCFIIVDGIQHASHGHIDIDAYDIDGYVISAYKVFSRHGYGVAWASERLISSGIEQLIDGPERNWEFGTRDTGAYAGLSNIVDYFTWLGSLDQPHADQRSQLNAAGAMIHQQEKSLTDAMINGIGNHIGLAAMANIHIIGGADNPAREGLVCFYDDTIDSADIVAYLNEHGVRTHMRKDDHYSGSVLRPLGLKNSVRVSMCHYNSIAEVTSFLEAMRFLKQK